MEKPPVYTKPRKWKKIIVIVGALIITPKIVYFLIPPKPPKIISFRASKTTIKKREQSILSWRTSNAVNVQILPNVGRVSASGSKTVSPGQSSTYTLIAKNEEGKTVQSQIQIQVNAPPFGSFYGTMTDYSLETGNWSLFNPF